MDEDNVIMDDDDPQETSNEDNNIQHILATWKIINDTLKPLIVTVEDSECLLETFMNSIENSAQDFCYVFIAQVDSRLNKQGYDLLQKKYNCFTTWLLGHLFYILGCHSLNRLHEKSVSIQLKIISFLYIKQPTTFAALTLDYFKCLIQLVNSHSNNGFSKQTIAYFIPDESFCSSIDLDLKQVKFEVTSEEVSFDLQLHILKILSTVLPQQLRFNWKNKLTADIYKYLDKILYNCDIKLKLTVIELYINLIKVCGFEDFKKNVYGNQFSIIIQCLQEITTNYSGEYSNIICANKINISDVIQQLIDVLCISEKPEEGIRNNVLKLCIKIITSEQIEIQDSLKLSISELCSKLLKSSSIVNFTGLFPNEKLGKITSESIIFTKYKILNELKTEICDGKIKFDDKALNILSISPTWSSLHYDLFDILQTLQTIEINILQVTNMSTILQCAVWVHIEFRSWHQSAHINKQPCFCGIQCNDFFNDFQEVTLLFSKDDYNSLASKFIKFVERCAPIKDYSLFKLIIKISRDILLLNNKKYLSANIVNDLVGIIASYHMCLFPDIKLNCQNFIKTLFPCEILNESHTTIQVLALEAFSIIPLKIDRNINDLYLKIFKNSSISRLESVKIKAIECLPIVYSKRTLLKSAVIELLSSIVSKDDNCTAVTIGKVLRNILCINSGNGVVLMMNQTVNSIDCKIMCSKCDRVEDCLREAQKGKLCGLPTTNNDFSTLKNAYISSFKYFRNDHIDVKKGMLNVLLPLFIHTDIFLDKSYSNIWLNYCDYNDIGTRKQFCAIFRKLVTKILNDDTLTKESKLEISKIIVQKISVSVKKSLDKADFGLQETTLYLIRELGSADSPNLLLPCIKMLIYFLMSPYTPYGSLTMHYLSDMTKYYNLTENFIYHKYKKDFCKLITCLVIFYYLNNFNFGDLICKTTLAFGFKGHRDFLSKEIHHILPCLIPWFVKEPKSQSLLAEIARFLQKEPAALVSELFFKIYPSVYICESPEVTREIMQYITKITHCSEHDLKRKDFRMMISEIIIHYHSHTEAVVSACLNLASIDPDYSKNKQKRPASENALEQVADFLQPRFLGVLGAFGSQLVNNQIADSVKRQVIESLTDLIYLMGDKYIMPMRFKVMATLRSALILNVKEYGLLNINAWSAFVHTVNIQSLGDLLSTIFVSLIPLIDHFPTEINNLFKFLVVNHESLLSAYMPDLFFISKTNVDANIKKIVESHMSRVKPDSLIDNIKLLLKQINHENIEVRQFALQHVTCLLSENKQELNDAILSSDIMHPVIVELIDALVTGKRESENLKLDYAKCLGELGAIEPSHLPRRYEANDSVFTFSATEDTFATTALYELTRAFQFEKHTKYMDCFALAIQEILKYFKISPTEKKDIWESFPVNMQEIMVLLLSSRYIVQPCSQPARVHPIFGSGSATTFSKWACCWIGALIPQITSKEVCFLFGCCKPSLNRDLRTLMLFLPYIVLHVLFGGNAEVINDIYEEMMTIINIKPNSYKTVDCSKSNKRSLTTVALEPIAGKQVTEEDSHIKCSKMVYVLIDFLERWIREWVHKHCPKLKNPLDNAQYNAVYTFVKRFDKSVLSRGNFECEEYPRALLYLEWYLEENEHEVNSHLSSLANIYAKLDESDAIAGIRSMMPKEPSLQDQILFHEVTGQLQDAAACYEMKAQEGSITPKLVHGMIRCYLGLDQPFMAYRLAHSLMDSHTELACEISESLAEPLWRLGKFDDLGELLQKETIKENVDWGVRIGQALLYFRNGERNNFKSELNRIRTTLMNNLTTVSMEQGAYQQGYPHIIKLHMLNEFENVENLVYKIQDSQNFDNISSEVHNLLNEWQIRLNILQSSENVIEPILCTRRIILEQAKVILANHESHIGSILTEHIAKSWMNSVRLARKAGLYQQAYTYILNAEKYKPKELFVEKAKLLWQKGEQSSAIRTLVRGVDEYFPNLERFKTASSGEILPDRKLCAEAKLLIAVYNDDSVNVGTEEILQNYKTAVEVFKQWEKGLVFLAQYYDKIYSTLSGEERENTFSESPRLIIHFYGNSLYFGCHYIYQSMPRMLSIWLDYATGSEKDTSKNTLVRITSLISNFAERLPCFMFLTAFSQLVSRICHPQQIVYALLKEILIKIILRYPQQSLWMILCVYKSSYVQRYKRCAEVMQDPRLSSTEIAKLIQDFNDLAEKLIDLTNKPIPDGLHETTVSVINRHIHKTFSNPQFSQIMMPVQEFRKIIMPSQEFYNSKKNRNEFNAFPNKLVYIRGVKDEVVILASLQKPRRITFKGSDGKEYGLLLKPKDDLRKDFRLMEFNTIVNQYLHKDPDARQRRLKIRTYSVLPLNEECGIIEWISNVVPLRPALLTIYKEKQIYISAPKLKAMWTPKENLETKRKVFLSFYIKNHPPVFPEWFRLNFPDPHGWYQAKCAYIRTTAVMSMVGYILGLGDRHGENILFDSTNGDTMHVDFNCLFNKGLAFEFPERVPFRMTHNMVKAMGPTGVEGMFRRSSEITMKILRAQRETLMSVLRPFVYDPLLSWSTKSASSRSNATERTDKDSMRSVENIEKRLQGTMRVKSDQLESTLSIEGQVNSLIIEATSIDNLCQMYIGWGPYL